MNIEINEKKYVAPKPKMRLFRQALELTQERDLSSLNTETLDELLQYVVDVYGNQFDINELYDEYDGNFTDLFQETIQYVANRFGGTDDKKK